MEQHSRTPRAPARRRGAAALALACAAAALTLAGAGRAAAQGTGQVGGQVVEATSLAPLSGAQVVVRGGTIGTVTNPQGRFVLRGLSGTNVELEVQMLGYRTVTRPVPVGTMNVRVELAQTAISLDELVVTGTPHAEQQRTVGNVVSSVNVASVVTKAPVSNVDEVLNGRVAGVTVLASTGEVGGASRIHIRGATSMSLSNTPLIYIDGIRVDNDEATGPETQSFGSSEISRWNDINPNEIQSIQVIKGPAAATLYGTEAAHGVIQIITKHGQQGPPQFHLQVKYGGNSFANPEGRLWTNWFKSSATNNQLESIDFNKLQSLWTPTADSLGVSPQIFRTGQLFSTDLNISGGNPAAHYFISGGYESNQGIVPTNSVRKGNLRMNMAVTPGTKWSVNGSFGYVLGRTDMGPEAGWGGIPWTTYYMRPDKIDTYHRGFYSYPPDYYNNMYSLWQNLGRFTTSVAFNYNPTSWFTNRITAGIDQTHEGDNELDRTTANARLLDMDSYLGVGGAWTTDNNVNYTTLDYAGNIAAKITPNLLSTTSFGAQYYRKHHDWISAGNEGFPAPGLSAIDAATSTEPTVGGNYINNTTVGGFGQEQIGWLNRRFLTVALRADDNSAFGSNFKAVYYPKVSGSWVLSDEPFFHVPALTTLKLRAAYGETGQQPDEYAAIRTYAAVPGPNGVATVTPLNVGNPNLGPERTAGVEAGFDAGVLNDRIGLELTYFNQQTRDAILFREIAPSSGFSGGQYVNAGRVDDSGLELSVHGSPVIQPNLSWELGVNLATNHNVVKSLGDVTTSDHVQYSSYVQHHIGYPTGSWFWQRIVSATVNPDGSVSQSSVMCDNGHGGSMPCFDAAGNVVAPEVYLGSNIPKLEGGVTSTLTILKNLQLFGQIDFKTGFSKLDGNQRVRCWFFSECRENWVPQEGNPVEVAGIDYEDVGVSTLIHKADFARLREVSLTYRIPAGLAQRFGVRGASLTVAGRNLATWTKYPGLDPEATFNGGTRGGSFDLWEQDVFPQLRQFVTTVNLDF